MFASKNLQLLEGHKITHILVVGNDLQRHYPEQFAYHLISIDDDETEDVLSHFIECFEFINQGLDKGGVLIHCAAGVSRSSTMTIAYLMHKHHWTLQYATNHVRLSRPCIFPNSGFVKQLELFEKMGLTVDLEHPDWIVLVAEMKKLKDKKSQRTIRDIFAR
jgi:protein-tyrosine phosphatase